MSNHKHPNKTFVHSSIPWLPSTPKPLQSAIRVFRLDDFGAVVVERSVSCSVQTQVYFSTAAAQNSSAQFSSACSTEQFRTTGPQRPRSLFCAKISAHYPRPALRPAIVDGSSMEAQRGPAVGDDAVAVAKADLCLSCGPILHLWSVSLCPGSQPPTWQDDER